MFYQKLLYEYNIAGLLILSLCIRQSFPRFVSEKNHEQIDRLSKDYFQERGLVLNDLENMYDQSEDVDSDISLYFQQPASVLNSMRDKQLQTKLKPQIESVQNLHMPAIANSPQNKVRQFDQEKLLQRIEQYKNELQRLRMPKMNNFAENNLQPIRPSVKQSQFYGENMLPMFNDNQKVMYNQKYIIDNAKEHTMLNFPPNIHRQSMYLENEQPIIDMSHQNE